jgi:putative SOS response-associated peptidase YedK
MGHGGRVCGRYASSRRSAELAETLQAADDTGGTVEPDFNVAPTKAVPAVVLAEGARRLVVLRWGLLPSWATDRKLASRLINARVETVAEKPAFRAAFAARRCLIPADGYYEWQTVEGRKQPFFLHAEDGGLLVFAGLHERWRDPDSGEVVRTCTVLTTSAPDGLGHIHDRAPLLVGAGDRDRWLDPGQPDPRGLLLPAVAGPLLATPVSTLVNSVRNNGPHLLDPIPIG